ncbi:MAG: T9SS type A sorting domain-containing protein [Candidatus Delongbacteria bacterium]|jgi:hypothetical protein|nr:T9SS type A sorting domain-containing protein [Candidatus Delongbacteria bacterium]
MNLSKKVFLLVFVTFLSVGFSQFSGGSGTLNDPYLVNTAEDLDNVRDYLDANFIIGVPEIDLALYLSEGNPGYNGGELWIPIGTEADPFTGTFNGQSNSINNLKINRFVSFQGLFRAIENATIDSLNLSNVFIRSANTGVLCGLADSSSISNISTSGTITSEAESGINCGGLVSRSIITIFENCTTDVDITGDIYRAGGIIGEAYSGTELYNCHNEGVVNAQEFVGGIIGCCTTGNDTGIVSNCSSTGNMTGTYDYVGGLIGHNKFKIYDSFATGAVQGSERVGGFIGNNASSEILNCYSTGSINSYAFSGGFIGRCIGDSTTVINNCYSEGSVTSTGWGCGGFVGQYIGEKISNCYAIGDVTTTNSSAGGFVGNILYPAIIEECYSLGSATGDLDIGGFIGNLAGDYFNQTLHSNVINCYARGTASGNGRVGGFTGSCNYSDISNCYSTGTAESTSDTPGGFSGYNDDGNITNCYWDTESSGLSTSEGGTGRTTDELTYWFNPSTAYPNWDFTDVWEGSFNNNDAYPYFKWQGLTGIEEQNTLPVTSLLYQNYPNPFNPTTEISFSLNQKQDVNLSVFNSKGELVQVLFEGKKEKGNHSINFDASGLNSGVYFYKLSRDETIETRRMLLLK